MAKKSANASSAPAHDNPLAAYEKRFGWRDRMIEDIEKNRKLIREVMENCKAHDRVVRLPDHYLRACWEELKRAASD